ncbi:GAF domain-containing protein [Pseudorhodoferax soli]|uniref:ABC-type amino acid transport substrate-binding protein n=1 Tax=Pseudorhodoferax soli TaxID=545864 RepID=A0A368XBV5_9BURK|nr:GAF domain-containing protein [Pseudorhodoferax soli]RCW64488.1 ABC-type amino acid transport substrate-binding protein [Pseudorhodoferax soli]
MSGGPCTVLRTLGGLALLAVVLQVQARDLAEIRRSGELRLCVAGSSAAYYQVNGEDFARAMGLGVRTTVLSSWDEQFHNAQGVTVQEASYEAALLANGRCDLYPNDLHMVDWRKTKMLLVPYFLTRSVVVARPELRGVLREPADLAGRAAAVQAGTTYEAWLRAFNATLPQDKAIAMQNAPTAQSLRRVAERRADFTVLAAESAFKAVRDDLEHLDLLFTVGDATEVGWGMGVDAHDLQAALARYFADSQRVGSRLDLSWRKFYGVSLTEYRLFSAPFDRRGQLMTLWSTWGLPLLAGCVGVFGAMLFWAGRLRREVLRHREAAVALHESQQQMSHEAQRRSAVSDLLLALQQARTPEAFGQAVLRELGRQAPVGQALFATVDRTGQAVARAHYAGAGATPAQTLVEMPSTAVLVDRCIATGQPVLVEQPGPDYLRIRSGLGHGTPAAIVVLPVLDSGRVTAVIEVAMVQAMTAPLWQLLEAFQPIVAVSLARFAPDAPLPDHEGGDAMAATVLTEALP